MKKGTELQTFKFSIFLFFSDYIIPRFPFPGSTNSGFFFFKLILIGLHTKKWFYVGFRIKKKKRNFFAKSNHFTISIFIKITQSSAIKIKESGTFLFSKSEGLQENWKNERKERISCKHVHTHTHTRTHARWHNLIFMGWVMAVLLSAFPVFRQSL